MSVRLTDILAVVLVAVAFFVGGADVPERSVIVRETLVSAPLSANWVEVFAIAPSLGVAVWDKDVTGPGGKPLPPADQGFLDSAKPIPLPALATKYKSGKYRAVPCPASADALRKAVGK